MNREIVLWNGGKKTPPDEVGWGVLFKVEFVHLGEQPQYVVGHLNGSKNHALPYPEYEYLPASSQSEII